NEVPSLPVEDGDSVGTPGLGLEKRFFRPRDEALTQSRVVRILRDSQTHHHPDGAPVHITTHEIALDFLPDPLRDQIGSHSLRLRQEEKELFASPPGGDVDVSDLVLDQNGDFPEQDVSDQIAEPLVHLAKVVDVHVKKTEVELESLCPSELSLESGPEHLGIVK